MVRFTMIAAAVLSLSGFAMTSFPDGKWSGGGKGVMPNGMSMSYTETLTVRGNVLNWELATGNQKEAYSFKAQFQAGQFLTGEMQDAGSDSTIKVTGYCASIWCHVEEDGGKMEMTLVFDGNNVYELGASVDNGQKGWFESALKKN